MIDSASLDETAPGGVPSTYLVVADHPDFLVIDKAAGVSVHRDDAVHGLVEQVAADHGYAQLYLVHRLDRLTSGLLLLAKSAGACAALADEFAQRRVQKLYVALSDHRPAKKQGSIRGDMERARNGSWRLARSMENPARTDFVSRSVKPGLRLFALQPATGKTHQLRVALKSLGAPIIGDARYGGSASDRGYLHACGLRFDYGATSLEFARPPRQGALFCDPVVQAAIAEVLDRWRVAVDAAPAGQ